MISIYDMASGSLIYQPKRRKGKSCAPELQAETASTPALQLCKVATHTPIKSGHIPADMAEISIEEFLQQQVI